MNIQGSINKLLLALKQMNKFYKIDSHNFFSKLNQKYCTKYSLFKKDIVEKINDDTLEIEYIEKYVKEIDTFSKVEILQYLVREYREGCDELGK